MTEDAGSGDRWSNFESEVLPHIEPLFRLAVWFERDRTEAEDLVQDTLKQALESFHRYTPGTNCRAWLVSILQHLRSNRRRARSRSPVVSDPDDRIAGTIAFVPPVPDRLTDEDVLAALDRIPAHYQEVIVLSDVEELTYKEIAATLKVPIGTVMSRLHRGRALLRQELRQHRFSGRRAVSVRETACNPRLIMQCREVRDLLDSFLGQELMVETNHELMRHLEGCPECRAELDARRQLRGALQRAFANTDALRPGPSFARDALAHVKATQGKPSGRSNARMWTALAASVLLITSVGLFVFGNRVPGVVRDAVGDHRFCAVKFGLAERPISLAEAAARYDSVYAKLEDTPPGEMLTAAGPLRVVERHSCVFEGRRFGHVVLRLEGHLVSLLLTADDGSHQNRPDRTPAWLPPVDGLRVASFATPGHLSFIVSDLPDDSFRSVTQALAAPVSERLAMLFRNIPARFGD